MKRLLTMMLVGVMTLGMIGCGNTTEQSEGAETGEISEVTEGAASSEKKTINIAWCDDTLDSTRSMMLDACKAKIEEINSQRTDIEVVLTYYDAQASVDQQISNVETAALMNPDVFIFSCVDSQGSLPCLQTMKDYLCYDADNVSNPSQRGNS